MSFLYPGFLFALLAMGIPVVIHLFRFRRFKTVYFPNVAFLEQLSDVSRRESRLKHLLVLLARMLAIAALVLAFAQPFIPGDDGLDGPGTAGIGVYIDNSFSMESLSVRGSLIDEARLRAVELASLYRPSDRFLLLTNDFEGRHQRFVSRDEFIRMVEAIDVSPISRHLSEVMLRKEELFTLEHDLLERAYYISDFQKRTSLLSPDDTLRGPPAFLIPLQSTRPDNVFIDSCWFDSPLHLAGQPINMNVSIRNESDQQLENQPLRLFINGTQRSVVVFDIAPGGHEIIQLGWSAGTGSFQQGHVEIVDYPVTFDDRMYFSYQVTSGIPVLILEGSGSSPFLHALFGHDELFTLQTMPSFLIDYGRFSEFNLVILDGFDQIASGLSQELNAYVRAGGSLLVFPGTDMELSSYNLFLQELGADSFTGLDTTGTSVASINELHPLFEDVFDHIPEQMDLPAVQRNYRMQPQIRSLGEDLLQLRNGLPLVVAYGVDEGKLYVSAVPLDDAFSNLQRHSLFVPMVVNMALQSGQVQRAYHVLGSGQAVSLSGRRLTGDQVLSLKGDDFEVIPEHSRAGNDLFLHFHDQLPRAGNFFLYAGDTPVSALSFNYDRSQSWMETHDEASLTRMFRDMQADIGGVIEPGDRALDQVMLQTGSGSLLWKFFLVAAMLFLLAEVFMLRFWK